MKKMNYVCAILIGYSIGSFPTAYILLKKIKGLDITKNGSGNVGAMNSYEVSGSKWMGIVVFLIDSLKGWLASFLPYSILGSEFIFPILGLTSAVFAHCYSPWLLFKGGRGLATAAGGAFFTSLPVLIIWAFIWFVTFIIKRDIHLGNIIATIVTGILSFIIPNQMIRYSMIEPDSTFLYSYSVSFIMFIIFSKHITPLKDYIKELKIN